MATESFTKKFIITNKNVSTVIGVLKKSKKITFKQNQRISDVEKDRIKQFLKMEN